MAYVLPDDDEQQNGEMGTAGNGGSPVLGSTTQASATPTPASSSPTPQQGGSGFVSWDRILNANKDAATASATKETQGIQQGGQSVQNDLTSRQNAFNSGLNAGNPLSGTKQADLTITGGASNGNLPKVNAFNQQTSTPEVVNFANQRAAQQKSAKDAQQLQQNLALVKNPLQYTGPNSLSEGAGWDSLLGKAGDAADQANALGQRDANGQLRGDSGVQALLQKNQTGNYTQGQSQEDAALLGAAGRGRFDQLQSQYGGLLGNLNSADATAQGEASAAKSQVANTNAAASDYVHKAALAAQQQQQMSDDQLKKAGEQNQVDMGINNWLTKVQDDAGEESSILHTDLGVNYDDKNMFINAEKSGDFSQVIAYIDKKYGAGQGNRWVAAYKDTAARQAREQDYQNAYGQRNPNQPNGDWFDSLMTSVFGGELVNLASKQQDINNGNWWEAYV